jgi:hypothetical protein
MSLQTFSQTLITSQVDGPTLTAAASATMHSGRCEVHAAEQLLFDRHGAAHFRARAGSPAS